jgi:serine/threonine-protein kinase RsbW
LTYQHTSQIETQTDPTALKTVLAWFDQFQATPIPHNIWLQCQLALIEGFTNAVRHAHAGCPWLPPFKLKWQSAIAPSTFAFGIRGPGFDLASMLRHRITVNDPDSEGGRGLKSCIWWPIA